MSTQPLPYVRRVQATPETVSRALAARGYDDRFVGVMPEQGAAVGVWCKGLPKLQSIRERRASIRKMLEAWGLEVSESGWTVVVRGEIAPTVEDVCLAAGAAMQKALVTECGDPITARNIGRVELVAGRMKVRAAAKSDAVALSQRLVDWLDRAGGLGAKLDLPRYVRHAYEVDVELDGVASAPRRERCPGCDGTSTITGAPCSVCDRAGYVTRAA